MKKNIIILLSILTLLLNVSLSFSSGAGIQNHVEGTLTVNGKKYEMKHVYTYEQGDDISVFMTDNRVSPEDVPFGFGDLAAQDKIHGFSIVISKTKKQLVNDSPYNAIYHKDMMGKGAPNNAGKLTVNTLNSNILEARLTLLDKAGTVFSFPKDHEYLYGVKFKVGINAGEKKSQKPVEIVVIGDDTPAGKAYASYYKAKMTGDIDEIKKWVIKKHVKDFDNEIGKMMIKMAMAMDPKKIKIIKTERSGKSARLIVKDASDNKNPATGSAKIVLEDGQWKIEIDKWDLSK